MEKVLSKEQNELNADVYCDFKLAVRENTSGLVKEYIINTVSPRWKPSAARWTEKRRRSATS